MAWLRHAQQQLLAMHDANLRNNADVHRSRSSQGQQPGSSRSASDQSQSHGRRLRESEIAPLWWLKIVATTSADTGDKRELTRDKFHRYDAGFDEYDDDDEDFDYDTDCDKDYRDRSTYKTTHTTILDELCLDFTPADMATWAGKASIRGSTETSRMMMLTCASIGIAFTWGVEMTYCTPYLLSLGLTKGQASFVWLAGPLSGLLTQPIVGVISDQSTLKWGRRRPFMVVGCLIVYCSLFTLGFTKEIVAFLLGDSQQHRWLVITLAVLALYVTDFAINAVMSCARSLLVDTLPIEKQQTGAAWASRMSSFGHLIGYGAGAVDLVALFGPTFGDTQFKKLIFVAATTMLLTTGVTCWAVTERVLLSSSARAHGESGSSWPSKLSKVVRQIWSTVLTLPPRIQGICWAVFWGWIGWFPFMFYSSTWVGETYFRYDVPQEKHGSDDALGDMGRIGSYALTAYSTVTVLSAVILPLLVRSPYQDDYTHRPPAGMTSFFEFLEKSRPDLLTVWTCGNLMFACAMFMAPFATSFRFATFLVSLCGIPWTVITWAPTAFLGVEVNKLTGGKGSSRPGSGNDAIRLEHGPDDDKDGVSASGELSGVYFGILNIYTTIPQFIGNLMSSFIFAILEPGKSPELAKDAHPSEHHSTDGPNAIAVTLFIGAIFAIASAFATRKLKTL